MKLFGYFRSSASYRVRIALNLKGLDYEQASIHLLRNGGEQFSEEYKQLNPESLVPALIDGADSVPMSQSLAMLEYIEESYPQTPLLPSNPHDRAYVRALALAIACDIHPVNNLRILKYLSGTLGVSDEQKNAWYLHWCAVGFAALEQRLANDPRRGLFCFGDRPGYADCVLIPQIFNAQRFNLDMSPYPTLMAINQRCLELPEFIAASPAKQADAE
ncbi:maleylacetoacetate isomerase [Undibacterium sp. LX40W]|uniref:Maleylacetoacetate isomerase n=1 Tax=Undibacterium nitidum TaxID=2762298 RepID=A0A923HLF3_9BURK|nr:MULTISPECIES: maleylacetoacetate isomerase [Undibacterium]MBC3880528.1 maleylacetoacetate isomerase [Undibacterium nitidum]MBC3890736.1 maleylacetoacetate isomerase [Undibacterium sp. LX40W]